MLPRKEETKSKISVFLLTKEQKLQSSKDMCIYFTQFIIAAYLVLVTKSYIAHLLT